MFSHQKRHFLLNKLEELIKVWASGSGHGCFNFTVRDGIPSLKCELQLSMEDIGGLDSVHHQQPDQVRHPRRRGPARQERDKLRAAKHQAALASCAAVSAEIAVDSAAVHSATTSSVSSTPNPSTTSVASSQTTTTTSPSFSMPLAFTRQLSPAMDKVRSVLVPPVHNSPQPHREVRDVLCPDSQYLTTSIPQIDGSINLPDQWSCKCCRYERFFHTEDQLQLHHETHMIGYEDCNICFTGHVWTSR